MLKKIQKYIFLLLLLGIFFGATTQTTKALNSVLLGLADNTWVKLNPNASQRYIPRDYSASNVLENQANPVARSYSGIAYGGRKVYYFGGGHGSYPGNNVEIYDIANKEARPVNGTIDIGAYEYGVVSSDTTPPQAPSGVTVN